LHKQTYFAIQYNGDILAAEKLLRQKALIIKELPKKAF